MYSAQKLQRVLSSYKVRKYFIDYFALGHKHKILRSSPVVPYCDPTLAFVNAGMNQFKSVFLGKVTEPCPRAVNSQKCVRVGGKHNDLSIIGQDGYHHTFFEMLGNWSFGDYFKREACEMAVDLLRGPYSIPQERLYVTYFAGDKVLGLPADLECVDIWRNLGFPMERILPFGLQDNFWEMGATGPCGPCTEIHYDHRPDLGNVAERAKLVNAGRPDLTELWNLVFIEYQRFEDGSVAPLPKKHVDTGMGFERLAALLQNKASNYDTDLFSPLFSTIHRNSEVPFYGGKFPTPGDPATLDTSYRILADHVRMITACLADGMLPEKNQKLRRVLRKAFTISEKVFDNEYMLDELVPVVGEILGGSYPEMKQNQKLVLEIIDHEQEVFRALRESSAKAFTEVLTEFPKLEDIDLMECPGFVPAYREFQMQKPKFLNDIIPGKFLFKLADTYGLNEENFSKLAELEGLKCDLDGFRDEVAAAKQKSKSAIRGEASPSDHEKFTAAELEAALKSLTKRLPKTEDFYKYRYAVDCESDRYNLPIVTTKVLGILHNLNEVAEIHGADLNAAEDTLFVVTKASNFYYESGGQESDTGALIIEPELESKHKLDVKEARLMNECIVHVCRCPNGVAPKDLHLKLGSEVELHLDEDRRYQNTLHHTTVHLINAAARALFNKPTYQVSSSVTSQSCKLELGIIGQRITLEELETLEDFVGMLINSDTPTLYNYINADQLLYQENPVTMVPGEIYPEKDLRIVTFDNKILEVVSRELCCGTHVTNTSEIDCMCFTSFRQTGRGRFAFTAVAGPICERAMEEMDYIMDRVQMHKEHVDLDRTTNATEVELQNLKQKVLQKDVVLPYIEKTIILQEINEMLAKLKEAKRTELKEFVDDEMKNLLLEKPVKTNPFLVHYISSSALVEEVPLQKATKWCKDRPVLVVASCDGIIKARCCVPKGCVKKDFNAEVWLKEFATSFNSQVAAPKGQDPSFVCNMKSRKLSCTQMEELLEVAMEKAKKFASKFLL